MVTPCRCLRFSSRSFFTHAGRLLYQQIEDAPCDNEAPIWHGCTSTRGRVKMFASTLWSSKRIFEEFGTLFTYRYSTTAEMAPEFKSRKPDVSTAALCSHWQCLMPISFLMQRVCVIICKRLVLSVRTDHTA
jgi:hypothetical protein